MSTIFAKNIPIPEERGFIKTLNNMGYMAGELDYFSMKFINYAEQSQLPVLDVGAAYGIATLAALKQGAFVYSNDIDKRHLDILKSKCDKNLKHRLKTIPGSFPYNVDFGPGSIGAILISRVLHFFQSDTIRDSLRICKRWLAQGGKLFLVSDTPYMKNWSKFIPEYCRRKSMGYEWPGFLEDSSIYAEERAADRPKKVNFIDDSIFRRELEACDYIIEEVKYIDRPDFPTDMRGLGCESVGAIAVKK